MKIDDVERARWNALQETFLAARELPTAEREPYLARACGEDAALAAEVRRMLAADACRGPLDRRAAMLRLLDDTADVTVTTTMPPRRVGPYTLGPEIGRGGMGVVYRAYDPRLRRHVALKFLPSRRHRDPEAKARFVNEARAASALDHPHVCPVYDVGTSDDGRLYIAMAWCGGGSLADRLAAGPLSVDEAVRVALQVAEALDAAHEAGIVHADVKPGNIAFTERGEARVLDFGVALLGEDEWAAPSTTAGTLAFMAPEQLRGEAVDRRTDVWALGVVLHEMLTGRRPFTGADRDAVRAAILHGTPEDPRRSRPEIPPAVARVVARALEKDPDARWPTARAMAEALRTSAARRPARGRYRLAALGALALAAGGAWLGVRGEAGGAAAIDDGVVVVLPFRVSGEPALGYLREGMVDLLAAKLTGEGGLRAADARTVLGARRRLAAEEDADLPSAEAAALARKLGAGRVLLGGVVGTPAGLVVDASLMDARGGAVVGRASVNGPHTELPALVDRLVAQLLSQSAGEEPQRLAALTSTSLPALRAYLEGQAHYRRGRYAEALEKYARALDLDSTFALAGLGMDLADGWVGTRWMGLRGRAAAWRWRERLGARDRALLEVQAGTAYPREPTARERIDAAERALRLAPDRAELWFALGDLHFHHGRIVGGDDADARAEVGLRRALELDSAFAPAAHHLFTLYARQRRTREMRALAAALLAHAPEGATADYVRWRLALADGGRGLDRAVLDSLGTNVLAWIGMITTDEGEAIAHGRHAVRVRAERPGTREERLERRLSLHAIALQAGRAAEALALTATLGDVQPDPGYHLRLRVLDALYGEGDRAAAERAAAELARSAAADSTGRLNRCVAEQWRLHHAAEVTWSPPAPTGATSPEYATCDAVVAAMHAVARGEGRVAPAVARLDSLVRGGPLGFYSGSGHVQHAPLALARLLEQAGDTAGALTAVRRRPYFIGWQPYLAASLRTEARLAAALGDHGGARRADAHLRALRAAP